MIAHLCDDRNYNQNKKASTRPYDSIDHSKLERVYAEHAVNRPAQASRSDSSQ